MFFLISASEGCERIVSAAISANIIVYLTKDYHMGAATSAIVILIYQAATNFLPILGAIGSDSLLGRFLTISLALYGCTIVRSNYLAIFTDY
jgi:solute carrier family 15 (peptide/histidine transporter), member 3/4